jgi:hypothetical protein
MVSSFFNSNNCSGSVLSKNWRPCTEMAASVQKFYPSGRLSQVNRMDPHWFSPLIRIRIEKKASSGSAFEKRA